MKGSLYVVFLCVTVAFAAESFEDTSTRVALKVYEDCSATEDFYVCLKKKAITFLDRLGRAEKFSISDSVKIVRVGDAPAPKEDLNEAKLDEILPRSIDAKNAALSDMLYEKISDFIGSRTIQISLPRSFPDDEDSEGEARFGSGGKKGLKGKKKGGMGAMGGMMMMFAGKMMAMKAYFLAGLFLLAKKALIISKIALLISGIIAVKKLVSSKNGNQGGGSVSHVYAGHGGGGGGGHDSGWSSGGGHGGGWDKRSADGHDLAYSAYAPK